MELRKGGAELRTTRLARVPAGGGIAGGGVLTPVPSVRAGLLVGRQRCRNIFLDAMPLPRVKKN